MKKKLLFVVSNLKVGGGAEKSVTMLTRGLRQHYDVEILTFYDFKEEYQYDVKRHSFGYKYNHSLFKKAYRLLFLFPLKMSRFLKKQKYDIVISNAEDANVTSLITKKLFHNYKLWTVIRNDIFDKKHPYYRFNFLQKYADRVVVLTKALQKRSPYPSTVIGNALDFEDIQKRRKEKIPQREERLFKKKTILMIGRLSQQKNHAWFFDVFREIKEDVNLLIIGNGPMKRELKEKAKNDKNIYFLGTKTNVYKYLNKADVFVLPSLFEGMPRVLMEALACGCTSIVNDCHTGPRELLDVDLNKDLKQYEETKYGYIVPFNNKKEYTKAIKKALKNEKKIKPDNRYTIEKITNKWVGEIDRN